MLPRICFLSESFYPMVGGLEAHVNYVSQGLSEKGFHVLVITRRRLSSLPDREWFGRVAVYRVSPIGETHFLNRWYMIFPAFWKLIRLRNQFDVLVVPTSKSLGIPAILAARLLKKRCILRAANNGEFTGEVFEEGLTKLRISPRHWIVRAALRMRLRVILKADAFICISRQIQKEMLDVNVRKERMFYIPNGVNADKYSPVTDAEKRKLRTELGLPEESHIVLFVGRIVVWKGVMVLLEAWKKIAGLHRQASLILVGTGGKGLDNCEPAAREFVSRSGLTSQTVFTGEVTNVRDYLRCADLFVFPSWDDGFSNSILEAMATGLPVIAAAKNAAQDVIDSGTDGLLVREKDPDQLAEALTFLLLDSDQAKKMGKRARKTIEQDYSVPHLIQHYSQILVQTRKEESLGAPDYREWN